MRVPKKKRWPKGLPKPGSPTYQALARRRAENKKIEAAIISARKALGR